MRLSKAVVVALALSFAPRLARADEVADRPVAPIKHESPRWYGWKILAGLAVTDGVLATGAVLLMTPSKNANSVGEAFLVAGAVGHCVVPPVIHFAEGEVGRGVVSSVINSVPPALFVGGALAGGRPNNEFGGLGLALAGVVAAAGMPFIDVGALAYHGSNDSAEAPRVSMQIVPSASPGMTGITMMGRF